MPSLRNHEKVKGMIIAGLRFIRMARGQQSYISLDHLPTFNLRTHLQAIWAAHHPFELHSQRQPPRGASETNFSQWYVRQVSIKLLWDVGFEAVDHTTSPLKYTWHVKTIIYYTICIYMYNFMYIYKYLYVYVCEYHFFLTAFKNLSHLGRPGSIREIQWSEVDIRSSEQLHSLLRFITWVSSCIILNRAITK